MHIVCWQRGSCDHTAFLSHPFLRPVGPVFGRHITSAPAPPNSRRRNKGLDSPHGSLEWVQFTWASGDVIVQLLPRGPVLPHLASSRPSTVNILPQHSYSHTRTCTKTPRLVQETKKRNTTLLIVLLLQYAAVNAYIYTYPLTPRVHIDGKKEKKNDALGILAAIFVLVLMFRPRPRTTRITPFLLLHFLTSLPA